MYACMFVKKPSQAEGFGTYIHTSMREGFLARSKMLETLTGRGVLAQNSESYAAVEMQKPSQGEGF